MTIENMIAEMRQAMKELGAVQTELKYKQPEKVDHFNRMIKHTNSWIHAMNRGTIANYRKAQITEWFKESQIAVKRAKKIQLSK